MIVMDIKLNNIFAFKNFHVNFSYPKKIVDTTIEYEFLSERENFRYKKVNIIMGSNATGKTTLGKSLMSIFNFIQRDDPSDLKKFRAKDGDMDLSIDFVTHHSNKELCLFRVKIKVERNGELDDIVTAAMNSEAIKPNDNYETCSRRLDAKDYIFTKDTVSLFDDIYDIGWYYSDIRMNRIDSKNKIENSQFMDILNIVMKVFDNSIKRVISGEDNSYIVIEFNDDEVVLVKDGNVMGNRLRLSSGTLSSIGISEIIANIIFRKNGFYFCDEKFSYVQSDLEKTILSIMIEALGKDQQLFFTTHNTDILDMDLPKHSFHFMSKNSNNSECPIRLISASDYIKKRTQSLRNAVENDFFDTIPDDDELFDILDLINE